jgi:predicted ribosome quality control (RQC) complex YloA/Tae2 family protein
MEISAIEISLLTARISAQISGYFLSGVYSMEVGALLRFNHASKPEKLVALASFAPWMTSKNLSISQATKFVLRLRDQIERCELASVEQIGNERIVRFSFTNRKGEKKNLYSEFFAHGNLILTEPASDELILDVADPQSFRHRTLLKGEGYALPPTRGVALQEIDRTKLYSILEGSLKPNDESDISAIKWFGRNIGTSRKFVEEIFFRSHLDPDAPLRTLDRSAIDELACACSDLRSELEKSASGYVLVPTESSELDTDVCPIIPHSWILSCEKGLATVQNYASLSEALDEVQIESLVLKKRRTASKLARGKAEELTSAIAKQQLLLERNARVSKELRLVASELIRATDSTIPIEIIQRLISYELLKIPSESPNQPRFVTEPKAFLKSFTSTSLASRLFDEAKRLEETNLRLESAMRDLVNQRDTLTERTKSQEERIARKVVTDLRERQWYERYRWFVSSDDHLIVGGRDSTSNSIIINKYTNSNDVVFHADLHGSPFFVVRNSGNRQPPSDELALEIAQATVGFSRAWKDELGSADAYWVFGDQIKKSAPSGEYLPRGAFFIDGKKNLVRHVKVELSIGVASHAPVENKPVDAETNQIVVICGPEKSITEYCVARLRFVPGKEKSSEFARRVLNQLVARVKDEKAKEATKKLSTNEIIRVLPSGGYKLVSENRV